MLTKHYLLRIFVLVGLLTQLPASCLAQLDTTIVEDFDQDSGVAPEGWNVVSGSWKTQNGVLVADSLKSDSYITFGDPTWQNYEVSVKVRFHKVRDSARWLSILFRSSVDGTKPWSQVPIRFHSSAPNGVEFAVRTDKGWSIRKKSAAVPDCKLNQPRQLKIVVNGTSVEGFVDGRRIVTSHLCVDRASGCVGLGVSGCVATFDDFTLRRMPNSPIAPADSIKRSEIVAHRGFSAIAPENTLAAIQAAIDAGATGCEFDVYQSADGVVVLMHDKTVDRTTNGTGAVTELTLKQLRKLDAGSWKGTKHRGEPIPTLREALSLLKRSKCRAVIEIKMEGITQPIVDVIRELDILDQVAIIAFSQNAIREVRMLEPRITCGLLCSKGVKGSVEQQADWLESRARECRTSLLDLNFNMLSPELIAELKHRKLTVWTWTVNDATAMKTLQQWGVDSITTDRPDLAKLKE